MAIIFFCLKDPVGSEKAFPYGTSAKLSENGRFALIAERTHRQKLRRRLIGD